MGDKNESFYDNITLKGIRSDQEIPICKIENTRNAPLIEDTPYLPSTSSVNTSKAIADALPISANSACLRLENYMDEKYDQAALNHLKKVILNDVKLQVFNEKYKVNLELLKSLKEQIDILKRYSYVSIQQLRTCSVSVNNVKADCEREERKKFIAWSMSI